jgi:ribosomal protein S18 acetylase RimI-like enzyme
MEIRLATAAELAAVGELCVTAYQPFLHDDHVYVETLRDAPTRAEAAELLVAADGAALLGTVTFVPDGGPLGEIATPEEAEFRMLAVDPAARGRGVGMALMRHVVAEARRHGKRGIVCSSLAEMRAAHRIYERLGFRRVPERDWSPVPGVALLAFAVALRARKGSRADS